MKARVLCPWCNNYYTVFLPVERRIVTCSIGRCAGQGRLFYEEEEWVVKMFSEINQTR